MKNCRDWEGLDGGEGGWDKTKPWTSVKASLQTNGTTMA